MNILTKVTGVLGGAIIMAVSVALPVSAHVVVKPGEALTGSYQTFTVSAPNEKDIPYVNIKLLVPDGVASVTPSSKPGWVISTEKIGEGEAAKVTSISWAEGSVDGGLRDDFTFSAKLPDNAVELNWKAYQTYADGTTVAWDQKEAEEGAHAEKSETSGPLSVTKVVTESAEDLAAADAAKDVKSAKNTAQLALYSSITALVVTLAVFGYAMKNK